MPAHPAPSAPQPAPDPVRVPGAGVRRPVLTGPAGPLVLDPAAGRRRDEWPSHWWRTHDCVNRRRCPHPLPLPGWWLLMGGRGVPFHPDRDTAIQMAKARIATYKGSQPVFDEPTRLLVQGIVIDSLIIAPQPVSPGWVHTSLMAVGGLVRWAMNNGETLTVENLLANRTRARFVNLGVAHMSEQARRNYRCRLDLIATALSGVPIAPTLTKQVPALEAVEPHTPEEIAALWLWSNGLRPMTRRDRVVSALVLGLGLGLRASEIVVLRRGDLTVDHDTDGAVAGVHAVVRDRRGGVRILTCTQGWEERLAALVEAVEPGHRVNSPWRTAATTARMLQSSLAIAQHQTPPPVWFSGRSLRNTWLVEHLNAGTPVTTLMDAAGIESIEALKAYLPYVPVLTGAERAAALRGPMRDDATTIDAVPSPDGVAS